MTGQRLARGGGNSLRSWRNPLESGERPFSEEAVRELLAGMSRRKAQGQDDIPAWLLSDFAAQVAPFLTGLFNLVLQEGVLPHQWTKGKVILFPKPAKSGKRGFRPITFSAGCA